MYFDTLSVDNYNSDHNSLCYDNFLFTDAKRTVNLTRSGPEQKFFRSR